MEVLAYKILTKRQELRDLLLFAMKQSPIYLPVVRSIKDDIAVCDYALTQLSMNKIKKVKFGNN